ncbi:MAG TPA: hypothetical protein VHE33_20750 [Acidobacteriaceae bacterium]|nr:hypothetical protein [Acidobacteriaceae bacterium]
MDISATTVPDSTQVNAEDFLASPRTVTITGVSKGTAEQPVNIDLAEFPGRAFRPCKSMRRVLIAAWGSDADAYIGRRMTLFCDPSIRFGSQVVGGIRISHLSHIDHKLTLALTTTRGKRAPFVVEPLADAPPPISDEDAADFARCIAESSTVAELDSVATALKSCDLGTHRKRLQSAWAERKAALETEAAK